jgi:type II secretory pathway predicted ATPase ExeA
MLLRKSHAVCQSFNVDISCSKQHNLFAYFDLTTKNVGSGKGLRQRNAIQAHMKTSDPLATVLKTARVEVAKNVNQAVKDLQKKSDVIAAALKADMDRALDERKF